jgi:hypothetical protein
MGLDWLGLSRKSCSSRSPRQRLPPSNSTKKARTGFHVLLQTAGGLNPSQPSAHAQHGWRSSSGPRGSTTTSQAPPSSSGSRGSVVRAHEGWTLKLRPYLLPRVHSRRWAQPHNTSAPDSLPRHGRRAPQSGPASTSACARQRAPATPASRPRPSTLLGPAPPRRPAFLLLPSGRADTRHPRALRGYGDSREPVQESQAEQQRAELGEWLWGWAGERARRRDAAAVGTRCLPPASSASSQSAGRIPRPRRPTTGAVHGGGLGPALRCGRCHPRLR